MLSAAVFQVDDAKALQQQIFVQNDLLPAVRNDSLGEASGRDHRRLFSEFLCDAVNDPVKHRRCAENDAASHAVNGICADQMFRMLRQVNLRQLTCSFGQRVQTDQGARHDHASDVIAVAADDREGARRSHVKNNDRSRIQINGSDALCDPVAAELSGVVDTDFQAIFQAGSDDPAFSSGNCENCVIKFFLKGRDDGRDDSAFYIAGRNVVDVQKLPKENRVLITRLVAVGSELAGEADRFLIHYAEDDIGISCVNCNKHLCPLYLLFQYVSV